MSFLHGIEVIEISDGVRPIRTATSSVIGLIGTAPQADVSAFPLNSPVLITEFRSENKKLGKTGTLASALDGIFKQIGATVVVVELSRKLKNLILKLI